MGKGYMYLNQRIKEGFRFWRTRKNYLDEGRIGMRWRAFFTKGMLYWKLYFISLIKFLYSCILRQDICTLTVSSAVAFKELKSVELWSVMLGIVIGMTFRGAGRNQSGDKGELSGCYSVSWFCFGSGHVGFACENSLSCSCAFLCLYYSSAKSFNIKQNSIHFRNRHSQLFIYFDNCKCS